MSQEQLMDSEDRYRMIFESANDGIIIHDFEGRIFDVNQNMYKRLGYTKPEFLKLNLRDLVSSEYGPMIEKRMKRLQEDGVALFESADIRKDGTVMPVEVSARFIDFKGEKLIQSIVRDISERRLAESLIDVTRKDRTMLLESLQHLLAANDRIAISSLENLAGRIGTPAAKAVLERSLNRLKAVAFIHRKILRNSNLAAVDFSEVIRTAIPFLYSLYSPGIKDIRIDQNLPGVRLDVRIAVACGLIVHELLSNALLHAFPGNNRGHIEIAMSESARQEYSLTVKDNGIGLPPDLDTRSTGTLGMVLLAELVDQLNGSWAYTRTGGASCTVSFEK